MQLPVYTNQRRVLRWRIVEAGIRPDDLFMTSASDPIILRGSTIDVTMDGKRTIVHFCRSRWFAEGFGGHINGEKRKLARFSIRFLCPVPEAGNRYSVDAELHWDPTKQVAVLLITSFTYQCEIPDEVVFLHDDVHQADSFVLPPEEPMETVDGAFDLYGDPVLV